MAKKKLHWLVSWRDMDDEICWEPLCRTSCTVGARTTTDQGKVDCGRCLRMLNQKTTAQ